MKTYQCEYIWLEAFEPDAKLRTKTKVIALNETPSPENLPFWSFDGISTSQAGGNASDFILKPVKVRQNTARENGYLVFCVCRQPGCV